MINSNFASFYCNEGVLFKSKSSTTVAEKGDVINVSECYNADICLITIFPSSVSITTKEDFSILCSEIEEVINNSESCLYGNGIII